MKHASRLLVGTALVLVLSSSVSVAQPVPGPGPGGGGGTPGGSSGQLQYNNAGAFAGANITGLVKGNGSSAPSAAIGGTDYASPGVGTYITSNTTVTAANWALFQVVVVDAASLTITLPVSTTPLATNGGLIILTKNAATLAIAGTDAIDGGTTGASKALAADQAVIVTTNGSGKITTGNATAGGSTITGTTGNVVYFSGTNTPADGGAADVTVGTLTLTKTTCPSGESFIKPASNYISVCFVGSRYWDFTPNYIQGSAGAAGLKSNFVASATIPTLLPNNNDTNTGVGGASGTVSLITSSVEKARVTTEGVQYKQATAPAISGTGTPTIATGSTDEAGQVTAGTAATSVIITFNLTHTNAPFCVVTDQVNLAAFTYTLSNTAITITQTATTGNKINYRCTFP
jgi:hypothetical protein